MQDETQQADPASQTPKTHAHNANDPPHFEVRQRVTRFANPTISNNNKSIFIAAPVLEVSCEIIHASRLNELLLQAVGQSEVFGTYVPQT